MEPRITYPTHLLSEHLAALLRGRRGALECPAGVVDLGQDVREVVVAGHGLPSGTTLRLVTTNVFGPLPTQSLPPGTVACVQIGTGSGHGYARGWVRTGAGLWQRAARLNLPGPVMLNSPLQNQGISTPNESAPPEATGQRNSRWSRTAGALGGKVYERAAGLNIGVVGLGRLGSLLARQLARFGVRRMVVADPDSVELHNTGEGEYEAPQIGLSKVQAWAEQMAVLNPQIEIVPVDQTITGVAAIEALKKCDLLFSAPDQPGARLAAAALATAYCRPLIDVGTRVHREGPTSMGADVRLITPERCLLCLGGVADEAQGLRLLESPDEEERFMACRDWQQERPGSLASLNMTATAIALRMLEDLVAGRIQASLWCHIEFQANGEQQVAYPTPQRPSAPQCCACGISGWGDAGLGHFTDILRRRQQMQVRLSASS